MAMSKRESEKVVKLSSAQEPGTVIPAKRKLVKLLMYTCLANVICPSRRRRPYSSGATKICSCFKMGKPIYPHTPMAAGVVVWVSVPPGLGKRPRLSVAVISCTVPY
uniref:Uncharacterized protein n=1 Tax=Fagus sylvatica TaxID=28930 RepID=A0A2N9GA29_FAGSY